MSFADRSVPSSFHRRYSSFLSHSVVHFLLPRVKRWRRFFWIITVVLFLTAFASPLATNCYFNLENMEHDYLTRDGNLCIDRRISIKRRSACLRMGELHEGKIGSLLKAPIVEIVLGLPHLINQSLSLVS